MSKKTSTKAVKARNLVEELQSMPYHGLVVTLGSRDGGKHKYADVVQALQDANLDPNAAKEFSPAQAFTRACRQLQDEGLIEVLRSSKDEIVFQLSKRVVIEDADEGGDQLEYKKQAKIHLNKNSGEIKCKNSTLQERAKKELDRCMEERTTSDVTRIVQGLFDKNADLMPLPGAIGVYVVLKEYTSFVDQIKVFLEKLGRRPYCLPIPAGTATGDKTVQETVEDYLESLMQEYNKAIEDFSLCTRKETIDAAAKKIVTIRIKIEAYATYLGDKLVNKLTRHVEEGKKRLAERIEELNEERATAPQGTEGKDRFGCRLGGVPAKINSFMTDEEQTEEEISEKCNETIARVKQHLSFWAERGCFERTKKGWRIKPSLDGNAEDNSKPEPDGTPF